MNDAAGNVEFLLLAEAGILEHQAILLCDSIRRFAGPLSWSPITVVSPRKSRRPSSVTLRTLEGLQVEYLPLEIDSPCPDYGPSFRLVAAAHVARRSGPPILVQLDSDTLFVAEPILLSKIRAVAARPVDVKGMCTTGDGDEFDGYWRTLCALVGVEYERVPLVQTMVDRRSVRASYNAGLLAVRRASGVFERTAEFFRRLVAADLRPWRGQRLIQESGAGVVSGSGGEYWGTTQAAFALAAVAGGHAVELLPDSYNFPLHMLEEVPAPLPRPFVHLHYHWLASGRHARADALLDPRLGLCPGVLEWLRARLPLGADERAAAE